MIRNSDLNKANVHDVISIRVLRLCGDSIRKPLETIFKTCLGFGIFPLERKKAILSLFIKKAINKLMVFAVKRLIFERAKQ